ncbi:DNA ligase [Paenibacillus thiaminolyticus]|uniref:ATP-dependent DNA ligase n=1 Tax=Paenibacillus thiaminolyticus TaxID=49283 RepID=UPI0023506321|nr:RNA ligase family protein [Paenibacillus thiaminolyticus]WCR26593.1 DNA ligase [Paenibacillus thiaminolyticus]
MPRPPMEGSGLPPHREERNAAGFPEALPPSLALPAAPMSPLRSDLIPAGEEWLHQLKWDGVRILALCIQGRVRLFSKRMLEKTSIYADVTMMMEARPELRGRTLLLDGEVVVFDPNLGRPSFPLALQRERMRQRPDGALPAVYVLFDVLGIEERNVRRLPYEERHRLLLDLFPDKHPACFVADIFEDGDQLWNWVEQHGWEGVVSKKRSSPYQEGKRHQDWFKIKKDLHIEALTVGYMINNGRPASVVLTDLEGRYIGKASIGLDETRRLLLEGWAARYPAPGPPGGPIAALRREPIVWMSVPIPCRAAALEYTPTGQLRHPRIDTLPLLK